MVSCVRAELCSSTAVPEPLPPTAPACRLQQRSTCPAPQPLSPPCSRWSCSQAMVRNTAGPWHLLASYAWGRRALSRAAALVAPMVARRGGVLGCRAALRRDAHSTALTGGWGAAAGCGSCCRESHHCEKEKKRKKKQAVSSSSSLAASLVLQLSYTVKAIGCEQQLGQGLHSGAEVPQSQSQSRGKDGAPPFSGDPDPGLQHPLRQKYFVVCVRTFSCCGLCLWPPVPCWAPVRWV